MLGPAPKHLGLGTPVPAPGPRPGPDLGAAEHLGLVDYNDLFSQYPSGVLSKGSFMIDRVLLSKKRFFGMLFSFINFLSTFDSTLSDIKAESIDLVLLCGLKLG